MATSARASTTLALDYGLLWWRLVDYTAFGVTSDARRIFCVYELARLRRPHSILSRLGNESIGWLAALGWLGQNLTIFPDKQLVAVRMRRALAEDYTSPTELNGYPAFAANVFRLVP